MSLTPVTVTVCGVLQLSVVKVKVDGATVASPRSPLLTESRTSRRGRALSTTVKSSVDAPSPTSVFPSDSTTVKPGMSSSVVVAVNASSGSGSKVSSDAASLTATERVLVCGPSAKSSSTPETVTVCGVSQSIGVNVSVAALRIASPGSLLVRSNTTSVAGSVSSTTVKLSVPPASVTVVPPIAVMLNPAGESLSVVVTWTV